MATLLVLGCQKDPRVGVGGGGNAGQGTAINDGGLAGPIEGEVKELSPQEVVLDEPSGARHYLRFDDKTQITFQGRSASALEFREGAKLRARFIRENGDEVARKVEVLQRAPGH